MNIGILKPDHLGDLVLAAPAVAALERTYGTATLFCHPNSAGLARHLFPKLTVETILFPHLDKEQHLAPGAPSVPTPQAAVERMKGLDKLFCLRWDGEIEPVLRNNGIQFVGPKKALNDEHAAVENRNTVEGHTGHYDIFTSYRHAEAVVPIYRPSGVKRIGLCISAGFRLNAWPMSHWLSLAERLGSDGMEITFIGGPAEATRLEILRGAYEDASGRRAGVIMGGRNFGEFFKTVAASLDLIVATDSGTAHLVSLVRPVISLFGGTPWRRFSPIGKFNVVLSRRYRCSPCMQFNRRAINSCTAQECLNNLFPQQVYEGVQMYLSGVDFSREMQAGGIWISRAPIPA
jgi:heptosyltransferase-2